MMASRMGSLMAWWDGRTLRERRMLAVMVLGILAVLAWLLVVRPAWSWRADAAQARAVAEADLAKVERVSSRLTPRGENTVPVDIQAAVAEANAATGLTPVMGMSPDGGLGFTLTNVSTAAAFGWLADLHARKVDVASLAVVENADATVSIEGMLTPAGG